eukprot:1721406-Amphidinium_carterae.1
MSYVAGFEGSLTAMSKSARAGPKAAEWFGQLTHTDIESLEVTWRVAWTNQHYQGGCRLLTVTWKANGKDKPSISVHMAKAL